ncbi:MAG: hypothetical protein CMP49_02275 [Flavobacteriales bacterium]|nr:hypothetical protein [Flavobacteriales bacterium]|tara:strand:+ start:9234 stop:10682 length:1449 start_codon:yes stop_codon:yes gene_type:complete
MKRKFIWNLLLVVVLNLLIKPFYILGIDAEVINRVGASVYGNYFALINFSFLLNIILDLGITNFNVKNIAQHQQLLDKHFSGIITLRIFLVLFYLLATVLIAVFIGYDKTQFKILMILALNQSLVAFILYVRSNLAGLHLFFQDGFISILDRLLLIIICSILLWGGTFNSAFQIEWFVYAQTAAYSITLLFSFSLVIRRTSRFQFHWNKLFAILILKKSLPYALLILLMTIYYRIDSIMLERMINDSAEQAGIYAQAYRFFEASNMLAYLFAALLLPILSRMIKLNESIHEIIDFSFKTLISSALILSIFCCFFSLEIIELRYSDYILESSTIFSVLMLCFICVSSTYIYGTLLTANGNLYYLNIVAGCGVILNIFLNLYLIPQYHALGSAIASLITQFLTGFAQIILCVYIFELNLKRTFMKIIFFISGLIIFTYILKDLSLDLHYRFCVYIMFSVIWLFITKLIKISDFNMLIENKFKLK